MKQGFTLIEMVAVLLILALLAAAVTGGLSKARARAWRTQIHATCRDLTQAWNAYLDDERKFPAELGDAKKVKAEYEKIKYLSPSEEEVRKKNLRVYLELTDKEKEGKDEGGGLRDHWGQLLLFSLDTDYDGLVENPYPEAFVDKGESTRKFEKVRAASIAWSEGDPRRAGRRDNPIVVWQ